MFRNRNSPLAHLPRPSPQLRRNSTSCCHVLTIATTITESMCTSLVHFQRKGFTAHSSVSEASSPLAKLSGRFSPSSCETAYLHRLHHPSWQGGSHGGRSVSGSSSLPQTTIPLAAFDAHSLETVSAGCLFIVSAHSSNTLVCSPLNELSTGKHSLLSHFTLSCCCWSLLPIFEKRIRSGQART